MTTVYILTGASPYRDDDKLVHCSISISEERITEMRAKYEGWGYYRMVVEEEKP